MSVDISTLGLRVDSDGVALGSKRLDDLAASGKKAESATRSLSATTGSLTGYLKIAAAALAALKLAEYIKDATLLAARVETLGVVMRVVGNNAGYTGAQMSGFTEQLKKQGITTQESMASLIKMAGAQMDLSKASQLARVAQDAAVIGNINSSEAFGRMIQGIRSGEVEILKTIGINVQFEQGYKATAATLGKTAEQLTNAEKTASRMNQVLQFGTNIAGAYEASMGTAGKQMLSMSRYTEELKLKIGALFTPALTFMVQEITRSLKDMDTQLGKNKPTVELWGQAFKEVVVSIAAEVTRLSMALDKAGGSLTSAGMLLFGPGAALGNANSKAQFERLAAANMEYEKRYREGEERLQRLANSLVTSGATGTGNSQEQARVAAADSSRRAKEEEDRRRTAAETAAKQAEAAERWRATYADLRKEIDMLNPTLTEEERAVKGVENTYTDLIGKKGADLTLLKQLKTEHTTAINNYYETADAIKATSDEFANLMTQWESQSEMEPFRNSWEGAPAIREELELMKLSAREQSIQIELRKLSASAVAEYGAEVRTLVGQLYDEQQAMAQWKRVVDRIDDTFHEGFVDMLEQGKSGWKAFCDSLKNTFKSIVADALYLQFAKPLVMSVVSSGAGVLGLPALSKAAEVALAPSAESIITTATASGAEAGVASGMAAAAPYIGVALVGAMAANAYFKSGGMWSESTTDQKWMRGAAMTNPIGWTMLLADWASGGGLFGTKWKTTSQGVSLGVEGGDLQGQFYTDQKKKKKWFKGNAYSTTYSELDAQWEEFIDGQYASIVNAMKSGAQMMGRDNSYVDEALKSFSSAAVKINLAGLSSEDQQKAVSDYFRKITNEALLALYPELEASIRLGEDAAAAWERMNQLRATNNSLLMQELELLGQKDSAGYMDLLNQQREMELLNMDATTQAIQRRVWALEDEKTAIEKITEAYAGNFDIALSAANALRDIMGSNLSTMSPEEYYKQTLASFQTAKSTGNTDDLPELGKTLLSASRAYNASGAGYTADYESVTSALAKAAGIAGNPTLEAAQRQVSLLEDIKELLKNGGTITDAGNMLNRAYSSTLPAFAGGGITSGLSFAGESGPEAVIPLPDGRTVPVRIQGSTDNYSAEVVAELKALREEVVELRKQSVGRLTSIETKARLVKNS